MARLLPCGHRGSTGRLGPGSFGGDALRRSQPLPTPGHVSGISPGIEDLATAPGGLRHQVGQLIVGRPSDLFVDGCAAGERRGHAPLLRLGKGWGRFGVRSGRWQRGIGRQKTLKVRAFDNLEALQGGGGLPPQRKASG